MSATSDRPSLSQSRDQLESHRLKSEEYFRTERIAESRRTYENHFRSALGVLEQLLNESQDLQLLHRESPPLPITPQLLEGLRYVTGPPISKDDLQTIVGTASLAPSALANDAELSGRVLAILRAGLDTRRFPWIEENRNPTQDERYAAVLASAALMATRRTETERRTVSKKLQEQRVHDMLTSIGLAPIRIGRNAISTLNAGPSAGEFTSEVKLGSRKADFVVGLGDGRTMAIECKVSNSALNSVKRLNNDAAVKAVAWLHDFGSVQIVPVAVLSGVYKLRNLEDAQDRGLFLAWDHDLTSLGNFILAMTS